MKIKTYKFTRGYNYEDWSSAVHGGEMCREEVDKWIDLPKDAKVLYVTVMTHPTKESFKYKRVSDKAYFTRTGYHTTKLCLQLKTGRWRATPPSALSRLAKSKRWPVTGYIKAEYLV